MDQNNNVTGDNGFPPAPNEKGTNNTNIIAISVLAIVVLVALGWYVVGQKAIAPELTEQTTLETNTPATPVDSATVSLSAQGKTDDVTSIDADLKATDLNSLNDVNKI